MNVGIRELRDGLSRHLAEIRAGKELTITDHGTPIARIVPVGRPTRLEQLIASGAVRPATRRKGRRPEPIRTGSTVSDLVDEQRG
ncbi:MAG: type II toxin-antitoxin system Phd/YefM family antitoxin [Dermatophilaceae bacterium]